MSAHQSSAKQTVVTALALERVMNSAGILGSAELTNAATEIGLDTWVNTAGILAGGTTAAAALWLAGSVAGGTAVTGGGGAAGGATAMTGWALASGGAAAGGAAAGSAVFAEGAAAGGSMAATGSAAGASAGVAAAGAAAAILAVAVVFWLLWKAYNWISRGRLIKLVSEITVWTARDTQVLAEKLKKHRESSEDEVKQVICNELWLESKALVKPLPADPLAQAHEGAAYQLLLSCHKMWPMTGEKQDIIDWMVRSYQRDMNDHSELEHAFDIHIESLRHWTHSVEKWRTKITRLSGLDKISFDCDEPGIPSAVICGKIGSGKSTLANALYYGCLEEKRVEQVYVADSDDSDSESDDESDSAPAAAVFVPREQVFTVAVTSEVETTQPKMMRSVGEKALYIIDTPGLADTKGRDDIFQQQTVTALHSLDKVSCFILCVSMSERSTEESKKQVVFFENQYGKGVWDHTIVVFTHCTGDKRALTSAELRRQFWTPLSEAKPAKIISMDNLVKEGFSDYKLKVLLKTIEKCNERGSIDTSEFTTGIRRTEKKIAEFIPQIEMCKNEILELLIRDEYLVDSITMKRSVMKDRDEYKSVDDLDEEVEPKSSDIDNEELVDNELMRSMIGDLKESAKEQLRTVREDTEKVRRLLKVKH